FAPDGQTLAAGCSDHSVYLWDLASGKVRQRRAGQRSTTYRGWHHGGVACLAFAPDGKTLAFGEDNRIGLLDNATGKEVELFQGQGGGICRVFYAPDGKRVITASEDQARQLLAWDPTSARPPRALPCETSWISHI